MNQSVGGHIDLLVHKNYNVAKFDYGCGPSSGSVPDTGVCGDDEDRAYEEAIDECDKDVDDEYNGDIDVQADGHVSSMHAPLCDVSNNTDAKCWIHKSATFI